MRMSGFVLVAVLALPIPAHAESVFDKFTGTWAWPDPETGACSYPPHSLAFSADGQRAHFRWDAPIITYENLVDQDAGYAVIAHDATSITLSLDGESRRTRDGQSVIWILRGLDDFSAYCWGRTDWPVDRCESLHIRCVDPPATS